MSIFDQFWRGVRDQFKSDSAFTNFLSHVVIEVKKAADFAGSGPEKQAMAKAGVLAATGTLGIEVSDSLVNTIIEVVVFIKKIGLFDMLLKYVQGDRGGVKRKVVAETNPASEDVPASLVAAKV